MMPILLGFSSSAVVTNLPANAGDTVLIPGSGRSPGVEMATNSSILAPKFSWTGEPRGLQSIGSQRVGHDLAYTHSGLWAGMWQGIYKHSVAQLCPTL